MAEGGSGPLRGLARTLLGFAETRARLAANEFEEQVLRLLELAIWQLAALLFAGLALVLGSVLVLLLSDANRVLAAALLAVLFSGAGAACALGVRKRRRQRPRFLSATLEELARDRERLDKP